MYWGGQAVRIILGSIIGHRFTAMENTLPASANVATMDLICFFIFVFILGWSQSSIYHRHSKIIDYGVSSGVTDQTRIASDTF